MYSEYQKLGFQKSEILKHLCFFNICLQSNTKTWMFKVQDFQASAFQLREHFDQSKLMISGHVSSFSSFMPILVLVEK